MVIMAPVRADRVPVTNPSRRPTLTIYSDAGMVDSIWHKNSNANGRVAKASFSAKMRPTSADVVSTREVHVIIYAWLMDSRTKLRFIRYAFGMPNFS